MLDSDSESEESGDYDEAADELVPPADPDREIWLASETPTETFSDAEGADEDGGWQVQIIGEEVDMFGRVRYEARWENWARADGSNITWDNDLLHPDDIKIWKKAQDKRRMELADASLDIEIWGTTDIVNANTRLRAQAYDEKLRKRKKTPIDLSAKMARLLADKMPDEYGHLIPQSTGPSLRSTPARISQSERGTSVTSSRSSATHVSSSHSITSPLDPKRSVKAKSKQRHAVRSASSETLGSQWHPSPSSSNTLVSASSSSKGKGRESSTPSDSPMIGSVKTKSSKLRPIPRSPIPSRRQELEAEWNDITRSTGAAPLTIVNDVDGEEIPPLIQGFQYIETGYEYSEDILVPDDTNLFVTCDCDVCSSALLCSCQEPSEIVDKNGRKSYAYTPEGYFAFNVLPGVEVIECNDLCQCDFITCKNRIAQKPRDIPIEIFKTTNCGWGIRAPVDVRRGKVLGIYTGLLIHRDVADAEEKSYCFDLDGREDPEGGTPDGAYSVDSMTCGNWTRFINHSCSPNLRVYLVIYDKIPERNTPYLAFVAMNNIPAGTEFTLDYNPAATRKHIKGKGKGKPKIPEGAKVCRCGAGMCRGYV